MKNLMKLVVVLIAIVTLNACSNTNTPEAVAQKYLDHMGKKEYAEAKKLGTEATGQMIDMVSSMSLGATDNKKAPEIKDLKCTTTGEKASCTYKSDGEEKKMDLVKQSDKWLVDMKKETPNLNMNEGTDSTATK